MTPELRQQLVIEKTAKLLRSHPDLYKPNLGTPTAQLRAMTDAQLRARYSSVCAELAAPNFVPARLKAPVSADSKKSLTVLQNERGRIRRIADVRGLDLFEDQVAASIHAAHAPGASDELHIGDKVHATYRNPHSAEHEPVESDGEIIKVENGRFGILFLIRLDNGQTLSLSKSNLKRNGA